VTEHDDLADTAAGLTVAGVALAFDEWEPAPTTPPMASGRHKNRFRFPLELAGNIKLGKESEWLIKRLLPAQGLATIYGPPGCGKSFLALDAAMHIALGWEWFGRKARPGVVVYIAAEAGIGMCKRVAAFKQHHDLTGHIDLALITVAPNLGSKEGDTRLLIREIKAQSGDLRLPIRAILIDTLARVAPGVNENSAAEMGIFIDNALMLGEAFNCVAVAVHHSGKDTDRGMRGSSALHGACDAEWQVTDANGIRSATLVKMKDGEDGLSWTFSLGVKEVSVDEDGEPVTSCFVVPETSPRHVKKVSERRKPIGQKKLLLDAVRRATEDLPKSPPASNHIPPSVPVTDRDSVKEMAKRLGFGDPDKPDSFRALFSKTLNQLQGDGHINSWNDGPDGKGTTWIWLK